MKILIPALIDRIKDEDIRGFLFRCYNTFKMVIIPMILLYVADDLILALEKEQYHEILSLQFWFSSIMATLVSLILAMLTGIDKGVRDLYGKYEKKHKK